MGLIRTISFKFNVSGQLTHLPRTRLTMQVPGHRRPPPTLPHARGCLGPRVPLPSRLFQGPQSAPALKGRGVGTGSRVHTLTGLQDEPTFPPAGGAGLARCQGLCRASCGPVPAMLPVATRGQQSPTYCYTIAQSCPTLRPHGLQHARPPSPSPTPGACSNSCPLSR